MKQLLEKGKYAVLLAVGASLFASIATFIWATIRMLFNIYYMFVGLFWEDVSEVTAYTVAVLDSFILAVILYIFAIALYELFIGELKLPEWLIIHDLDDLKKKLSSVITLMLAVTFLEHLARWEDPQATLMFAIAIGIVIFALVFYMRAKEKG